MARAIVKKMSNPSSRKEWLATRNSGREMLILLKAERVRLDSDLQTGIGENVVDDIDKLFREGVHVLLLFEPARARAATAVPYNTRVQTWWDPSPRACVLRQPAAEPTQARARPPQSFASRAASSVSCRDGIAHRKESRCCGNTRGCPRAERAFLTRELTKMNSMVRAIATPSPRTSRKSKERPSKERLPNSDSLTPRKLEFANTTSSAGDQLVKCCGATTGCKWTSMQVDIEAHERGCPHAICARCVAPIHEQNRQQREQLEEQAARLADVLALLPQPQADAMRQEESEATLCRTLRVYKSRSDVVAVCCERLATLCGGGTDNARRQAAVNAGALPAIVSVMRIHATADADVQTFGGMALGSICFGTGEMVSARQRAAVEAGALPVILDAMKVHASVADVQGSGCRALAILCCGTDADDFARKVAAADAGALSLIVTAMKMHAELPLVQLYASEALNNISQGQDATDDSRLQAAADLDALTSIAHAMRAHADEARVQEYGARALASMCRGFNVADLARKQQVADAGALAAIVAAMQTHADAVLLQEHGCNALASICMGTDAKGLGRVQAAADAGVLPVIVRAMEAHRGVAKVQEYGCEMLANVCSGADVAGNARKQAAADAGVVAAIVSAMKAHRDESQVQRYGCLALGIICTGAHAAAALQQQAAAEAGAVAVIVNAIQVHAAVTEVREHGCMALRRVCYGSESARSAALESGAQAAWLV